MVSSCEEEACRRVAEEEAPSGSTGANTSPIYEVATDIHLS